LVANAVLIRSGANGVSVPIGRSAMARRHRSVVWVILTVLGLAVPASAPLAGCSSCDTEVSTSTLPDATVGSSYGFQLDSDCGGDAWFLSQGNLPPGIGLNVDGELSGVPAVSGIYTFTIGVVDFGSGEQAFKGLSLTVFDASPTPTATVDNR
jgi:hypothetical protein